MFRASSELASVMEFGLYCLDTGTVFRIHHYWEIWKVVSTDCTNRHHHSNYDVITSLALGKKYALSQCFSFYNLIILAASLKSSSDVVKSTQSVSVSKKYWFESDSCICGKTVVINRCIQQTALYKIAYQSPTTLHGIKNAKIRF